MMFSVPSPSSLLHYRNPNYAYSIASKSPSKILKTILIEENSNNDNLTPQDYIDVAFYTLSKKVMPIWNMMFNTQEIIQKLSEIDDPKASLFLSNLSFSNGDRENGIYFLKQAAIRGCDSACNSIGTIYLNDPYFHTKSKEENLTAALYWFVHAYRYKSYDSVKNIAYTLELRHEFLKSVHFYVMHFSLYPTFKVAEVIARVLIALDHEAAGKLCKYCVSVGSINCLSYLKDENPDFWLPIYSRFVPKTDMILEFYVPMSTDDILTPAQLFEKMTKPDFFYSPTPSPIQYSFRKQTFKSGTQSTVDLLSIPFNPDSPSLLMSKVFACATEDFGKRNLLLCSKLMQSVADRHDVQPLKTSFYNFKKLSKRREDKIALGFIHCIAGMCQEAYENFFAAASLGSNVAMTMIGVIEFHGLADKKRNTDFAVKHFLRAPTNPIALAHLAVVYPEAAFLNRLKDIVNEKSEGKIFEWVGDLFFFGVKLPKNVFVAKMFYAVAMKKFEENGEDLVNIIQKLSS